MWSRRRVATAVVLAATMPLAACTPEAPPTPPVSTVQPTPPETQVERDERLALEGAEQAYVDSSAEIDRLYMAGGATKPTRVLLNTTTGIYLKFQMGTLKDVKKSGWSASGPRRTVGMYSSRNGNGSVEVVVCEDGTVITWTDSRGRDVTPKVRRRFIQTLTVLESAERWKVSDFRSKPVDDFENQNCGGVR